jgi:hypothetical protein
VNVPSIAACVVSALAMMCALDAYRWSRKARKASERALKAARQIARER